MSGGQNRGRGSRGGPRGRGKSPYRGRGGRGRGGGSGGISRYHTLNDMGEVYLMDDNSQYYSAGTQSPRRRGRGSDSGTNTPRGRGRGRGDFVVPRGHGGIGDNSPRGRGKGRGGPKLGKDAPLSNLLFQERPLLRPIIFVPSVLTKTLFQEEEEIFQAVVEEVGDEEQNHVPTADRVFRVFSGGNIPRMQSDAEEEGDGETLEEIDFNDMAKLMETPTRFLKTPVEVVEEKFSGIRLNTKSPSAPPPEVMDVDAIPQSDSQPNLSVAPHVPSVAAIEETSIVAPPLSSQDDETTIAGADQTSLLPSPTSRQELTVLDSSSDTIIVDGGDAPPIQHEQLGLEDGPIPSITFDPLPAIQHEAPEPAQGIVATVFDIPATTVELDHRISEMSIEESIASGHLATPVPTSAPAPTSPIEPPKDDFEGFYIDTQPSQVDQSKPQILEDDEEIIVYVAPHPGRSSPPRASSSTIPFLPTTSILTGTNTLSTRSTSTPTPPRAAPSFDSVSFSFTPTPQKNREFSRKSKSKSQTIKRRQEAHAKRRRMEQQALFSSFGSIGVMMEEAKLRGVRSRDLDPLWDERRRGDSDVDWGDSDEGDDDDNVKEKGGRRGLAEGMDLDPDLDEEDGEHGEAMRRFAKSMGPEGSRHVTMDDIADGQMMRLEDEEAASGGSSNEDIDEEEDENTDDVEADMVLNAEERLLISEPVDDMEMIMDQESGSDEEDSDDEFDASPRTSFQARLENLRKKSIGKGKGKSKAKGKGKMPVSSRWEEEDLEVSDEEDDDDEFDRADEDEDFIEEIQMLLDENQGILFGRDRKARNKLFRAVHNGAFEDLEDFKQARKSKDKYKDLPQELQEQWKKDRDKKAENKRLRALKRLEIAADPMSPNKGGKKGRKLMLAAAKLDPTITVIPNRVIDMTTLVQQIRRFIQDIGGPQSMSLPPTNKETRKRIHEMALAFNLKSVSKGKGDARYTTLVKTSKTGLMVDERKVARIIRISGGGGGGGGGGRAEFMGSNIHGGRGGGQIPRHREGDEVGKAAPKIGESNIGFKMLALMGWSEGERIGTSGGLDAPLTAVIKNSKRGLGATK